MLWTLIYWIGKPQFMKYFRLFIYKITETKDGYHICIWGIIQAIKDTPNYEYIKRIANKYEGHLFK